MYYFEESRERIGNDNTYFQDGVPKTAGCKRLRRPTRATIEAMSMDYESKIP